MAMDADVRLLIGVARGGADGDSEALIRKELNEIMGKIKLEAKLDSKSFGEQIRKQLDAISNIRQGTVYLQEYLGQLERGEISVDGGAANGIQ